MMEMLVINKIALKLGPFAIHWYAILIVTGSVIGVWLACRESVRRHLASNDVTDFVLWAVPFGLLGVRIYYVIFQWSYYSQHPSEIIALWDGGGAIYGGLVAGVIVLFILAHIQKINPLDLLDIAVPAVLIGQAFGRWGNFVNQEAYGNIVSNLNWLPSIIRQQMFIDGAYRQPTFLFESLGTLIAFLIIMILRHHLKDLRRGEIFGFYLIWYGIVRFIVEGMRTDSLMLGNIRISQLLSLLLACFGISFILYRRFKIKTIEYYNKGEFND